MSSSKRTANQQARRDAYQGSDASTKQSSHYISAQERSHFDLANKHDSLANYRMQEAFTNQSVHRKIDNHLLRQSHNHSMEGGWLRDRDGHTITSTEIAGRVQMKIDVAKQQGDIHNDRYRNFLHKAADAYGLDLRQFNGYN